MKAERYYPVLAVVLSAASGFLLAYALPSKGIGVLGWIAFVPLLLAARISRPLIAAGCGLLCSLSCALILAGPITEDFQFGNLVAAFGSLGLVLSFAAGFASVGKKLSPMLWPFFVAASGVTGELLSVYIFPINVAISQFQNPAMLRLTSFTAIWGVSFLIWLVPASIIVMVRRPKAAWPAFALAVIALVASAVVKFPVERGGKTLRVAAIQAADAFNANRATRHARGSADLVVWPEHRLGSSVRMPSWSARANRVYLVADLQEKRKHGRPYNAAYLYSPGGLLIGRQHKRSLYGDEKYVFTRGTASKPFKLDGFTAGMAICYDTQFTGVIRDLVRQGADILLVPVHDPEMPNGLLNYLHAAVMPFRAAENGVPIVWAECCGLSNITEGSGRVAAKAGMCSICAVTGQVRLRTGRTVASVGGDYFAYLCGLVMIVTLAAPTVGKSRRSDIGINHE